jgi:hypothetical protein
MVKIDENSHVSPKMHVAPPEGGTTNLTVQLVGGDSGAWSPGFSRLGFHMVKIYENSHVSIQNACRAA